jgi:hypothetical protein
MKISQELRSFFLGFTEEQKHRLLQLIEKQEKLTKDIKCTLGEMRSKLEKMCSEQEKWRYRQGADIQSEPPAGTPLKCALAGGVIDHSGVYLGGGLVAELTGDGDIVAVSLSDFLNGAVGEWDPTMIRTGFRIFAACDKASGNPLGSATAAALARDLTVESPDQLRWNYDLRERNCHRFTATCLRWSGDGMWTLTRLEHVIEVRLNHGRKMIWRAVEPDTPGFQYDATPGKHAQREILNSVAKGAKYGAGVAAGACGTDYAVEHFVRKSTGSV